MNYLEVLEHFTKLLNSRKNEMVEETELKLWILYQVQYYWQWIPDTCYLESIFILFNQILDDSRCIFILLEAKTTKCFVKFHIFGPDPFIILFFKYELTNTLVKIEYIIPFKPINVGHFFIVKCPNNFCLLVSWYPISQQNILFFADLHELEHWKLFLNKFENKPNMKASAKFCTFFLRSSLKIFT